MIHGSAGSPKASLATRLRRDPYFQKSVLLFVGSAVVSLLNYAFYPALGRILSLAQYGEVQTLVSLFTQSLIIFMAVNIVTVNLVVREREATDLIYELQRFVVVFIGLIALGSVVFWPSLRNFLHLTSTAGFVFLIVALALNIPYNFWLAFLQAEQKFGAVNLMAIAVAAIRLVIAVGLVHLGYGIPAAISAIVLGQIGALMLTKGFQHDLPSIRALTQRLPAWKVLRQEIPFVLLAIAVTFTMTFLYSGDVLVAKHYFGAIQAGRYAGISALSNTVFFATIPFTMVMLPNLRLGRPGPNRRVLFKTLLLVTLVSLVIWALFFGYAPKIITLVFGSRYLELAKLLPILTAAVAAYSLANTFMFYLLGTRNFRSILVAAGGLLFYGYIVFGHHGTLEAVGKDSLITAITVLALAALVSPLFFIHE